MVDSHPWKNFYTVIDPLVSGGMTRHDQLCRMTADEVDIVAKAYQLRLPHNPSNEEKIALILLHERQPYTAPVQLVHHSLCNRSTL
jgi:hypothetical protein